MNSINKNMSLLLSGYYELAYRAYYNTSFSPEKRAEDSISGYSDQLKKDLEVVEKNEGDTEWYKTKYIRLWSEWMGAKSRCISSMITGPSNFPVRRAEKANNSEHNKYVEFENWRTKVLKKLTTPESTAIVRGSEGAIDKMESKLEFLEYNQELMKAANKVVRDKQEQKELRLMELGISAKAATELLINVRGHGTGFPRYSLTNNGAVIRNLKKEIEAENNRLAKYEEGNKEYKIGIADVVENVDENRLQLFFDGKPADSVRTELKKCGYRWSPRNGCWQRQLTENAIYSLKRINLV
jgi:hypothetical protein